MYPAPPVIRTFIASPSRQPPMLVTSGAAARRPSTATPWMRQDGRMNPPLATFVGVRPHRVDGAALRRRVGGRTVVVTGASRGVGRAVAARCAAARRPPTATPGMRQGGRMNPPLATFVGVRPHRVDGAALRRRVGGRTVVVTGASRGVGRAVAARCAAAGAHVVLLARDGGALASVADRLTAAGRRASTIAVDLRDTDAARDAAERVLADHGPPALLVSNAGHSIRRDLAAYTDRFHDVTRLAGVNLLGPIALALPLLAAMRARGGGHLVS